MPLFAHMRPTINCKLFRPLRFGGHREMLQSDLAHSGLHPGNFSTSPISSEKGPTPYIRSPSLAPDTLRMQASPG